MNVVVGGAHGLVGSALVPRLLSREHRVVRLVRGRPARDSSEIAWDPESGTLDRTRLRDASPDAIVNLAGANLARWPWTAAYKRQMWESRVRSNALLAEAVTELARKPAVFHSASAVGYYGNRGDEILREESSPGVGFLADLCRAWEGATEPAARAGTRVVQTRFGVILTAAGGALPKIAMPFRLGAGGRIGSGRQYMPWVALEDAVEAIVMAIERNDLAGPLNVVSPQAVTNAEFAKTLARVVRRPALIPLPASAARLLFGEMAREALLAGQRVEPAKLLALGYVVRHPSLEVVFRLALSPATPVLF